MKTAWTFGPGCFFFRSILTAQLQHSRQTQLLHQFNDALGRRFRRFGAGDLVDGVPAFAGLHGIKATFKLRIIGEDFLGVH